MDWVVSIEGPWGQTLGVWTGPDTAKLAGRCIGHGCQDLTHGWGLYAIAAAGFLLLWAVRAWRHRGKFWEEERTRQAAKKRRQEHRQEHRERLRKTMSREDWAKADGSGGKSDRDEIDEGRMMGTNREDTL